MKDEELYHLIDLLDKNINKTLSSCHSKNSVLNIEMKAESVKFDKNLIKKLQSKTKGD
ncbi:MAG: hypothetical protein GQ570_11680 [Helicobacteraceae bacterium]|nr:hypothetical protein [Helicobacteraceae bacterium]